MLLNSIVKNDEKYCNSFSMNYFHKQELFFLSSGGIPIKNNYFIALCHPSNVGSLCQRLFFFFLILKYYTIDGYGSLGIVNENVD